MKKITTILLLAIGFNSFGQEQPFTEQDTLRGSITPERSWWDLKFYHLKVEVEPDKKYISGSNTIRYTVLSPHERLQVDLQPPLKIEKVTQDGQSLSVDSNGNAHFINLKKNQWQTSNTWPQTAIPSSRRC